MKATPHFYRRYFLLLILVCCFSQHSIAQQINIDDSFTPQELIENNLVLGCVQVSNISSTVNGSVNGFSSYGYFHKASSSFPFDNGIVLSTGNVLSGGNVVNANDLHEGDASWTTDADLEAALGITNTLNATTIQFDFISASNNVQFNYILASEEYTDNFPCFYSDGFAFLIKETGTANPFQNIALVPGTSTPVNTSTIHNEIVGVCAAENSAYFQGSDPSTNFNGRTTELSAFANITPNVQYTIKLVIADQTDRNYDSAVFIQGNSFTDSINLGEDISTCDASTTLDADTNNPLASYNWYQDGILLPTETSSTLFVDTNGIYTVEITVPLGTTTCTFGDSISVLLNDFQIIAPITDMELCDDMSNDGAELFDLSTKTPEMIAALPASTYSISYHIAQSQAETNSNAFTTLTNFLNPQTVYIRAEDLTSGCVYISSLNLVVNPFPIITDPAPIEYCSDNTTGIVLTDYDDGITNSNTNLAVSYHYSQVDASVPTNPVASPYIPTNPTEQLFIRVLDTTTGCLTYTSIMINTVNAPSVNPVVQQMNACEQDDDGFEFFDLTTVIADVLQGATNVTVSFHTTPEDADNDVNPIADPTNYQNTMANVQIIYIRVENDNNSCYTVVSLELHTQLLETGTNLIARAVCDVAPDDGLGEFDLMAVTNSIANGLPDIVVTYYPTELDMQNNTNPIDDSVPFTTTSVGVQTLYLIVENSNCATETTVNFHVNPSVSIPNVGTLTYCDTDDDALTAIELADFDAILTAGMTSPTIAYYPTLLDAESSTNQLAPFMNNTTNPTTIYVRVSSIPGCFDIEPLTIDVLPAPTVSPATGFVICDDDQDAFSILDLTSRIPEIVVSTTGLDIAFFPSITDADDHTNEIVNAAAYNAQTSTIYTKVGFQSTGCYTLVPIDIIVNTLPDFIPISDFRHCETDGNQIADFILSEKDLEILNGQTGKEVYYYETAIDASNNTFQIDKNNIYNNISQVQTIYVRVENLTDATCFGTSSFIIEVGSEPIYDPPVSVFVCDDISNDGIESFDLDAQTLAITQNSPETLTVAYYLTEDDATNQVNAITGSTFTNTINPQSLYVKIDNGTYCQALATFEYNVVQVPQINSASALRACDTDTNGSISFDLTVAEFEVLSVRQDNIIITYYPSEADLDAETNAIVTPTNYFNTSNPQTVYIEVKNTITNCGAAVPIELIVDLPPAIANIPTFEICPNATNSFDLTETITPLIGTQPNVLLTFHANITDAQLAQNPLNTNYTYLTNSDIIYVRAEFTDTNCVNIDSFTLQVNPLPIANPVSDLSACDDDFDGLMIFDLSQQTATVLGSQNPINFSVTYYESETDAIDGLNPIGNLNYQASDSQIVFIRVENNLTQCFSTTSFSTLVYRLPFVEIIDQPVCLDDLPLSISADTGDPTDTYLWSTGEMTAEISILAIGNYSVTVTSNSPLACSSSTSFNIFESEQANIDFTVSPDFTDPHTIIVELADIGIGDYLFQLDDEEPQSSNVFENVGIGPHLVTVIDLNGCRPATQEVVVIDAPLFMTPNGDGYFDTWHITGVDQLPGTIINIYDRYGKLLTTLNHASYGWDGTYNGHIMPASDYWYLANVVKGNLKFEVKGHFTLRR